MELTEVLYERKDGVARITINNAFMEKGKPDLRRLRT